MKIFCPLFQSFCLSLFGRIFSFAISKNLFETAYEIYLTFITPRTVNNSLQKKKRILLSFCSLASIRRRFELNINREEEEEEEVRERERGLVGEIFFFLEILL